MYLIGDKKKFAIEFEVINMISSWGKVLLYFDGKKVGHYEEETNLKSIAYNLCSIEKRLKKNYKEFINEDYSWIFNVILEEPTDKYDSTLVSLGESFDDFEIRCIVNDEVLTFMWRLVANPFHEYKDYDCCKIFSLDILFSVFDSICREFSERIKEKMVESGVPPQEPDDQ